MGDSATPGRRLLALGVGGRTASMGVVLVAVVVAAAVLATVGVQRRALGGCVALPLTGVGGEAATGRAASVIPVPGAFVRTSGSSLLLNGQPFEVRGANYYPSRHPWDRFWPEYDQRVIDRDFAQFAAWGLNTVRVFVRFDQFGGGAGSATSLDKLANLLQEARRHGLFVIPTLFDFHSEYQPSGWAQDDLQTVALLTRFRDDPAVLAWDIKNELDLDYPRHGMSAVNAWLVHELSVARQVDRNHLLTVGWATAEDALTSPVTVDIVSFHAYDPLPRLATSYAALRQRNTDRPLLLEEFGSTTWSATETSANMEREQARYLSEVLDFLATSDAAGFAMWTPYDFENVPSDVGGPSRIAREAEYGVVRVDGSAKPSLQVLVAALHRPSRSSRSCGDAPPD